MRTVLLCFALIAGMALAQDVPTRNAPAVSDIRDVQLGMSRDHVLAGLGNKYDLTLFKTWKTEETEWWTVYPKREPKSLLDLEGESGDILFSQGNVSNISIKLYSSTTGESTRFAERLFWLLYNRANVPDSPTKESFLDKFRKQVNARFATVPMQLSDSHDDKHEDLKIVFTVDGQDFLITIHKRPGQPDYVTVDQTSFAH